MDYLEYFYKLNERIFKTPKVKLGNTCDEYNIHLIASDFYMGNKTIFVVLPTLYLAQKYYDSLASILKEEDVLFFPADELVSAEMISATGDFLFERIQTLYTLMGSEKKLVIANMHGAIKYEMNKDKWQKSCFTIHLGDSFDIKELCKKLVSLGYEMVYTTVKTGQFSRRGSIVDIFPLGMLNPIRLDFFGDELDTMKLYDVETQRSKEKIDEVTILPVSEFIYNEEEFELAKRKISSFLAPFNLSSLEDDMYKRDIENLSLHKSLNTLSRYLRFFENQSFTLFDFKETKKIYFVDPVKSKESYDHLLLDLEDSCGRLGGYSLSKMDMFLPIKEALKCADVEIEGLRSIGECDYLINAKPIEPYKGNPKLILQDLLDYRCRKKLVLSISSKERREKINSILEEHGLVLVNINDVSKMSVGQIHYMDGGYPSFDVTVGELMVISESTIFDTTYTPKKIKYKSIYKNASKISHYDELTIGDYVVHYDYGIGKYMGIRTITQKDITRDFIYIMYANNSALMLPLEKISSLMKYASADTEGVTLHELGGTAWARQKAKVRKRVHDISDQLISLYAQRQAAEGFSFPKDSDLQYQFEEDFQYDLTPDQKKAVDDVKRDMESSRPMDRLICGDVGYGKTEVALRAAFKAVMGGKQVAVLAPTTILARQHYYTFKERMEEYGAKVELLNRFIPQKKQKEIIEGLALGSVDVVIGTHRLLSKEVEYYDLGLLIVDEEQRFGVTHKEKIKALKVNVDCITLSATPIPRTLQMSVMGIKDLSMIETPPKNRYPIQTYVLERNDRIIRDAIERELARGGQVFYLYNRVDTIMDMAAHLHDLVPEARICVGHGKLSREELEDVITSFINKEYDVLLCTTIIETGIDMPDTNTLLIHDADRLGLSQMYQIRGRVGRSSKIAYAYLMYEPRKVLTPEAEKRLETIKEFNELGSGFKIAMRDLSIRGSGDLLGEEQSGFVESVGIDIYLKILEEELEKKKHPEKISFDIEKPKEDISIVTPMVSRTIKSDYINNDDIRIEVHKKIDAINSIAGLHQLEAELIDRFGQISEELYLYMYEKLMKSYCKQLNIYKIDTKRQNEIIYYMEHEASQHKDGNHLFQEAYKAKVVKLGYKDGEISFTQTVDPKKKLLGFQQICDYFSKIL
ncbi:transcription-repair coupling factor (superfamily II helicase) [Anaeroplasma bactoclasticum]|uniref:Transcription-repair-coupling factor n=1 Tax=Anaeroplasma bactoclasticum TaxID=2088 RepID=A0A397S798_9MOLU|nr:transcription-repair coupling factor [Anaeroplasma bactoclasticum]RIA78154.1 transcription-repair coupling factor (superfamily II helicase) [Anaeroplasma bactoclasticum]